MREVSRRYQDPLDRVWTACAERVGLRIQRGSEAYASTDGRGTLTLGTAATLDADDCLAQMVFHELCHALVQGVESFALRDWGLDNRSAADEPRERATLRVQAALAGCHGLRVFLAPTTEHRAFFDQLPRDPLAGAPFSEIELVQAALERAYAPPFAPHVDAALAATAAIVRLAAPFRCEGISSLYESTPHESTERPC